MVQRKDTNPYTVAVFFGGGGGREEPWPWASRFSCPKRASPFYPPPPPQCICQNVQKYSVRCLKVVPGVPKMVLIRSKSKNTHPYLQKQPVRYVPKLFQMAPKWPELDQNLKIFSTPPPPSPDSAPRPPAVLDVHTQGPASKKWPRAPKFENRHCPYRRGSRLFFERFPKKE